ncbi:hypothetical protein ASG60_08385 [Methylobacterium sp. Leaf469]|uniref:hypothetical protein n=1 Tax=Methylobacterium sp. Leaf469 TaxID=1736387 RepID=UPI0006FA6127|nr:hypothetical protein [Methylobacterium sp. Leaf469]KQT93373.1 hypothetical protein ASG60_08385 [Methylobacterium sp. Leaf469]
MGDESEPPLLGVPARVLTDDEVVTLLRRGVVEAGSKVAFARAKGVNETDLGQALRGRKAPTSGLCRSVGVERALVLRHAPVAAEPPD